MNDNEPQKTPRKVTKKTIVMQMEMEAYARLEDIGSEPLIAWKDMASKDFGDVLEDFEEGECTEDDLQIVNTFKDATAAKKRLRKALESGKISGGTFRVASCTNPITPTVKPEQRNVVSF